MNNLHIVNHGGQCCGVRHLYNFYTYGRGNITAEDIRQKLDAHRILELRNGPNSRGKIVEAIITDSQFAADPNLAQALYDNGFRIVNRFYNSTGGLCNVLHRTSGKRDLRSARKAHVRLLMQD